MPVIVQGGVKRRLRKYIEILMYLDNKILFRFTPMLQIVLAVLQFFTKRGSRLSNCDSRLPGSYFVELADNLCLCWKTRCVRITASLWIFNSSRSMGIL